MIAAKQSLGNNSWCAFFGPDSSEWEQVWLHLKRCLPPESDLNDRHNGECWEYMGTWFGCNVATHRRDGRPMGPIAPEWLAWCWTHQFRHRNYYGERRYINVVASRETQPEIPTQRLALSR